MDISLDDLYRICNLYKKPRFKIRNNVIRIDEFLNSYGNFNAFLADFKDSDDGNLCILKFLYNVLENENMQYCLVGKIGYKKMFKKYFEWLRNYFNSRQDLDLIRRIYVTLKKSYKYLYRYNYNTCIDIVMYFKRQDYWDEKIMNMFNNKEIDRLNLYSYKIEEQLY